MPVFTHKITSTDSTDGGVVQSVISSYTGQTLDGFDGIVPAATTDMAVNISFLHAAVKSLLLYSSQALLIKTNNATTPGQTLNLAAGQQVVWGPDHLEPNPITADVTELFLSNSGANPATVKIQVLSA